MTTLGALITPGGQLVDGIHPAETCQPPCAVHAPSGHALADAPLHWRNDRRIWERICEHGVGHPDPDDQAFKRSHGGGDGVHGCDGCCGPGPGNQR